MREEINMRRKYFILYIILFSVFLFVLINYKKLPLDEIWCYGYSKRIAEGYIPYKDYGILQTPLFFFLGILFSKSILLFRVYAALINSAIVLLVYHNCKKNVIEKQLSFIIVLLVFFFMSVLLYASYNTLLLFVLMVAYIVSNRLFRDLNSKDAFLFGLLLSIAFLIKQNVPGVLILIYTGLLFFMLWQKRIGLNSFINYAIGGVIPVLLLIFYLFNKNCFTDFLNNTFLQASDFSEHIAIQTESIPFIIISLFITLFTIIRTIKSAENRLMIVNTMVFNLSAYLFIYPLVDAYHSFILLVLCIFLWIPTLKNVDVKLKYLKEVIIICLAIIYVASVDLSPFKDGYVRSNVNYYKGILIAEKIENNVSVISDYIKKTEKDGMDVAVIGYDAYFYDIPAGDVNGILDSLPRGEPEKIISLINEKDIILTNNFYGYSDIQEVSDYVYNNFKFDGTIGNMDIYTKNE